MKIFGNIGLFFEDSRGDRIERYEMVEYGGGQDEWLYIYGPKNAVDQLITYCPDICDRVKLDAIPWDEAHNYSTVVHFPWGISAETDRLLSLLSSILTLRLRSDSALAFALALDFYKVPSDDIPPREWPDTPAGRLVNRGKYWGASNTQRECEEKLCGMLADTIAQHAGLQNAPTIASIPGHEANGNSFGERVARRVSALSGKHFVALGSRGGARQPAKEAAAQIDLVGDIFSPVELEGPVVLIDDVYHTGSSIEAAAHAIREAGGGPIYALVGARTMRR